MAVPFHRLKVCGSILVAARGASIHTFNITDGSHIAAWQVPQPAEKEEEKPEEKQEDEAVPPPAEETAEAEGGDDEPPSKRRRTDETEEDKDNTDGQQQEQQPQQENNANGNANGNSNPDKKKKKHKSKAKPKPKQAPSNKPVALRTADLPVVSILEATTDGRHLVVMMGHDKTLRVLSHDLQGHLTQLSARVMPKRPCAVAFTADEKTILSGDKFGDVYALPLIEVEKTEEEKAAEKAAKEAAATAEKEAADKKAQEEAIVAPLRLEANKFTVHTKGNRQALENQRRQKELLLQQGLDPKKKDLEASSSEYQLLLGHVSMLTAVAVAEGYLEGEYQKGTKKTRRPLILTADRDEHIRVTRGVVGPTAAKSQTHVIETFCLGHTSFVSRLCIPASRPDRLVSGGGDGELRVWNFWPEGRLVGTADLASLVAGVSSSGDAEAKVALSGLYAFGSKAASDPDAMTDEAVSDAFIVAICERIPALFFFRLAADGATLSHTQTLQLPEGQLPLDVAEVGEGEARRLLVATASAEEEVVADAPTSTSLLALTSTKEGWTVAEKASSFVSLPQATAEDDPATASLDRATLRKLLLQSNESLRKDNESEE